MCFHASIISNAEKIENRTNSKFVNDDVKNQFKKPHYHLNGFAHPNLPIITQELPDKILPAVWGIAPYNIKPNALGDYFKKASGFGGGLNARAEKLNTHFLYKNSIMSNRCLILIDAFFEPYHRKSNSYPFLIKRKDHDIIALAGIYTRFENGLITCAVITKPANTFLAEIHNEKKRQPAMMPIENEKQWLNSSLDIDMVFDTLYANYNDEELKAYPVSKKLHNPKEDSNIPEILEPYSYPELNTLF